MSRLRFLIFITLLVFAVAACSPKSSDQDQDVEDQYQSVQAVGTFICDDVYCDTGTITLEFDPSGGPVKGEGETENDGKITNYSFQGKVYENGELKGSAELSTVDGDFSWTLVWSAEHQDGVVEGLITIPTDDYSPAFDLLFTLSY